ncbi:hypothetical protein OY671_003311 [Metschnikowia pulcherrima]|nr:hypothetical protein OY671_003311 [Metschnikowia pulcherrima]
MRIFEYYTIAACLWGLAHSVAIKPKKPSEDEFYRIPYNISDYNEGDIVKWRDAPQMIRSLLFPINVEEAWQFMVRSTNSQGEATGIVGTLLKPYDADPSRAVVYSFAEDSASPDCAPSYSILFGASINTVVLQAESTFMNVLLTKGWYVIVVDYEGPNAAFLAARLAGMATLDSIRGALSTEAKTNLAPSAKVALWGFSGGSIPTSWAALLQPSYAPDLENNLVGAAFGGWVSNITRTMTFLEGGIFSGFVASGIVGLVSEYPNVSDEMWKNVDQNKIEKLNETVSQCLIQTLLSFPFSDFFSGDDPYFPKFFEISEVNAMWADNIITVKSDAGVPKIPLFLYHGKPDEIVPFENAEEGFEVLCDWGVESFEFSASNSSGHIVEYIEGAGAALKWIEDRFQGSPAVSGCKKTERFSNLHYPGIADGYFEILDMNLNAIGLEPLGPSLMVNETLTSDTRLSIYDWIVSMRDKIGPIPLKRDESFDKNDFEALFGDKPRLLSDNTI